MRDPLWARFLPVAQQRTREALTALEASQTADHQLAAAVRRALFPLRCGAAALGLVDVALVAARLERLVQAFTERRSIARRVDNTVGHAAAVIVAEALCECLASADSDSPRFDERALERAVSALMPFSDAIDGLPALANATAAPARAQPVVDDSAWSPTVDEDMIEAFLEEGAERIEGLAEKLVRLEGEAQGSELVREIFRDLHTLKGSSAFVGLGRMNRLAHAAEDLVAKVRDGTMAADATIVDVLLGSRGSRFLGTMGPQALVGAGGDSFGNPDTRGFGSVAEPASHWISYRGRVEWTDNDLMMPGVGLPLIFQRIYRGSVSNYDGPLGKQWEFNWNKRIQYDASGSPTRAWFYELGRREDYVLGGGVYASPIGRYDNLTRTGTPEYIRTDREGIQETYAQEPADATSFRLKEIKDLNGNTLAFSYDSDSLLTKVTDTLLQDTTMAFDGNGRVTKVTDSAGREWVYGYGGSGLLTTVRTPTVDELDSIDDYTAGKTTTYKYDSSDRLTEVVRPGDGGTGKWKWAYDGSGRITKETRAGNDINLTYDDTNNKVTVVDRESDKIVYWYDASHEGNLITKRQVYWDASNYYESTFAYDAAGNVTNAVFPKGNRLGYTFDGSGNVLTVEFKKDAGDGGPIKWIYTWASNARLSTLKDPNGNIWDQAYDGSGNLISKTAPAVTLPDSSHGTIRDIWAYNASGQVTRHTDPCGTLTDTTYTSINSKSAYPNAVTRDSAGLILITQFAYNAAGNVTGVTDPNGNSTAYTVNALNQVIRAIEPLAVTRWTHYDANNRVNQLSTTSDATNGNELFIVERFYDVQDNLTSIAEDLNGGAQTTTTYAYDDNDRLTKVTSPEGNETVTSYNSRDLVAAVTRKAASSPNDAITTYTYDENGMRVTVTDPRGNNTRYAYDGYDRLTKTIRPEGNYATSVLDGNGNVLTRDNYNAGTTKLAEVVYTYDQANRLYQTDTLAKKANLSTDIGDGVQTNTLHRDEMGRVLSHSGDVCGCSLYEHVYDAVGRQVTSKDPMGNSDPTRNLVLSLYDKNGNVTKSTRKERSQATGIEADKDIITEMVFDARNRMVTRKERLDVSTTMDTVYSYGLRDQLTKVVDGNGDEHRIEHNEKLWRMKDVLENGANDVRTEYTYDDDGRLVNYKARNSTTGDQDTSYTYDKLDRPVTTAWPVGGAHVYTYDKAGNRISTTDPNGTVLVCSYDNNNRLTSRAMSLTTNVVGATSHTFGYDGMDRMTAADSSEGMSYSSSIDRTFNTFSQIETETQVLDGYASGAGRTISYVYDEKGKRLSATTPVGSSVVHYTRDALDRVDKVSRGSSEVADYTWNGSRPVKIAYPGSHTTLLYDGYGRLTDMHHKDTSSGNSLARFSYLFDGSSQITAEDTYYYDDVQNTRITGHNLDEGDQYGYDGAKRLVTVLRGVATANIANSISVNLATGPSAYRTLVDYKLDQTGNRLTRQLDGANDVTASHDAANEMTTENGNTLTYNNNGAWTGTADEYRYCWNDQFGRYIKAGGPAVTYTWHYDALGRRVQFDDSSNPTRSLRYYYDGDQMIEVAGWTGAAESASKEFIFGDRIDDLLLYVNTTNGNTYYAHKDHLGSVAELVNASGAIQEGFRYKEYGETTIVDSTFTKLTTTTSVVGCPIRYTGREEHNSVGATSNDWYYYRAREYRSEVGRFIGRDSRFTSEGGNAYLYVRNSPLMHIDPSGNAGVGLIDPVVACCLSGNKACCGLLQPKARRDPPPGPPTGGDGGVPIHCDPSCVDDCENLKDFLSGWAAEVKPPPPCITVKCTQSELTDSEGKPSCAMTSFPSGGCPTITINTNPSTGLNLNKPYGVPSGVGPCGTLTPGCALLHELGHVEFGPPSGENWYDNSEQHAVQFAHTQGGC